MASFSPAPPPHLSIVPAISDSRLSHLLILKLTFPRKAIKTLSFIIKKKKIWISDVLELVEIALLHSRQTPILRYMFTLDHSKYSSAVKPTPVSDLIFYYECLQIFLIFPSPLWNWLEDATETRRRLTMTIPIYWTGENPKTRPALPRGNICCRTRIRDNIFFIFFVLFFGGGGSLKKKKSYIK